MLLSIRHTATTHWASNGVPPTTVYTYDAAGNLDSTLLPDQMETTYHYDEDRLKEVVMQNVATSKILFDQIYTLASNGQRIGSTETTYNPDGTSIFSEVNFIWKYDNLDRLISEQEEVVLGGSNAPLAYTDAYTFDLANNRITEVKEDGSGTMQDTITDHYNGDDQLTEEDSTADGTTTYAYDANGSKITVTNGSNTQRYCCRVIQPRETGCSAF